MRILITGINGFAGGHYLKFLESIQPQAEIMGISRQPQCVYSSQLSFTYRQLDLQNDQALSACIASFKPDYIVHLASQSSVGKSWSEPRQTYTNNTLIFLNIIEQVRLQKLKCRILSVGSGEEYGMVIEAELPLREQMLLKPNNPYAVARVSQEMLADVYVKGYYMDIVQTRSFNHIGPGQSDQFVISSFAKKIMQAKIDDTKEPIIHTGDISIIRDFLDVRDVVHAYHNILTSGKSGEIYNVCSGKGIVLRDMLDKLCALAEIKATYVEDPSLVRSIDNKIIIGSNEKLSSETGWIPSYSLENTLHEMLIYWKNKLVQSN